MTLTLRLSPRGPGEAYAPIRSVGEPPNGVLGCVIAPADPSEDAYFVVDGSTAATAAAVHTVQPGDRPASSTPVEWDDVMDALTEESALHMWRGILTGMVPMLERTAITGDLLPLTKAVEMLHRMHDGFVERRFFGMGESDEEEVDG